MSDLNGNGRDRQQDKVRVAIIGVGNCANSFMQGLQYYKDANADDFVPGLMHVTLGGYHVRDIEVVAAFDVAERNGGVDLAEAILAPPNNTLRFAEVLESGVVVERGPTLEGLGKYLSRIVTVSGRAPADVDDIV